MSKALFLTFLLLSLCFSANAVKSRLQGRLNSESPALSAVRSMMENKDNAILSFITTRLASEPTSDTMTTLLSQMAEQYEEELNVIESTMISTENMCSVAEESYDLSVSVKQEYLGVIEDTIEDVQENIAYYSNTVTSLENLESSVPDTVTGLNTLLASTDSQCNIMLEILETTDDQLEEIVETVENLEPTSLTTVNSPGEYVGTFLEKEKPMENLLQEKSNKITEINNQMVNLVQFSQADLSMAYNYIKQLQSSVESALETYEERSQYTQVGVGTILAAASQLGDRVDSELETLTEEQSHLTSMAESYEFIEGLIGNSIQRYQNLESVEESSCAVYEEKSEELTSTIQEGLDMIQELENAIMSDYENLYYYLSELTA